MAVAELDINVDEVIEYIKGQRFGKVNATPAQDTNMKVVTDTIQDVVTFESLYEMLQCNVLQKMQSIKQIQKCTASHIPCIGSAKITAIINYYPMN